jgi:hypothetical protein
MSDEYQPDSPIISADTPSLTGSPTTLSGVEALSGAPDASAEYNYVTGPDGQMYAVQKEPFVWKKFFIGLGVPLFLMLLPLILMMIVDSMDPWDDESWESTNIDMERGDGTSYTANYSMSADRLLDHCWVKENEGQNEWYECESDESSLTLYVVTDHEIDLVLVNGTAYSANLTLDENESVNWCELPYWLSEDAWYDCRDQSDGGIIIIKDTWKDGQDRREQVGHWNASEGVLHFDDGEDHDSEFEMKYSIRETVGGWTQQAGVIHYDDGEDHGTTFDLRVETYDREAEDGANDTYATMEALQVISTLMCMAAPLAAIGMIIYGFAASGGKAMGIGATVAIVSYPVIGFFGCIIALSGGF